MVLQGVFSQDFFGMAMDNALRSYYERELSHVRPIPFALHFCRKQHYGKILDRRCGGRPKLLTAI
jgi:hypothetical protein